MGSVHEDVVARMRIMRSRTHDYDFDANWTFVLHFQVHLYFWSLRQ